jgi:hypothetical protein
MSMHGAVIDGCADHNLPKIGAPGKSASFEPHFKGRPDSLAHDAFEAKTIRFKAVFAAASRAPNGKTFKWLVLSRQNKTNAEADRHAWKICAQTLRERLFWAICGVAVLAKS